MVVIILLVSWSMLSGFSKDGIYLSKKTQRILSAEMNAIQNGITNLAVTIPAGQWNSTVETAQKMKNGYIMKNKLSGEELKEFYLSLPAGYKSIDHEFQNSLNNIIQSAKKQNIENTNSHFHKLIGSCVKCHSEYAKKRFPGFK